MHPSSVWSSYRFCLRRAKSPRQVRSRPPLAAPSCPYRSPSLLSSSSPFNEGETFAAPMTHASYDHLPQLSGHRPLQIGRVTRREQTTTVECDRGERDIHGKLRLQPMTHI